MILLSVCIVALVMLAIFFSLWDILMGRWSNKKRMQDQLDDQDMFDQDN